MDGRTDRRRDGRAATLNAALGSHSITFQHRVHERYVRYVTHRQTNITETKFEVWAVDHFGLGLT